MAGWVEIGGLYYIRTVNGTFDILVSSKVATLR